MWPELPQKLLSLWTKC